MPYLVYRHSSQKIPRDRPDLPSGYGFDSTIDLILGTGTPLIGDSIQQKFHFLENNIESAGSNISLSMSGNDRQR